MHTPDILVLCGDSVFFEECKTEDELKRTQSEGSTKFILENGIWRCPAGEEYSARYKIGYKVFSSKEIDWTLLRNIDFLWHFFRSEEHKVSKQVEEYIVGIVEKKPGIRLDELLRITRNRS